MIAFVRGIIEDITEDTVVLDTGSIGYNIKISGQTAASLPGIGKETKLYTYTLVREDAFLLYGFMTRDELEIFKKLRKTKLLISGGGSLIQDVTSSKSLYYYLMILYNFQI